MTNDIQRKKNTGEPTANGGHFGSKANDPSSVELTYPQTNRARINGGVHEFMVHDELPEWPAAIEKPEATTNFDGGIRADFWFGGEEKFGVEFWDGGNYSGTVNSIDDAANGAWPDSWSDEDREAVVEWMTQVYNNIDADVYSLSVQSMHGDTANAVIANAQRLRHNPFEGLDIAGASAKRVETIYGDTVETEDELASALADLRHYAAARGIDFGSALETADGAVTDELRS